MIDRFVRSVSDADPLRDRRSGTGPPSGRDRAGSRSAFAGVMVPVLAALLVVSTPESLSGTEMIPQDRLEQDTVVVLDTIPVTGSRVSAHLPRRTRAIEVLTRETLAALPASDLAGALAWAMGIELAPRSAAQADVSMRGAGFEQVLVLVDGVRMSDPQTGHFDLDLTVPLEGVERVEILRGPASASYGGDAVGGVIHVITRDGPGWEGRVEGGSFGTFRGSLRGSVGLPSGARMDLSAEQGRSDGHREGTDWDRQLLTMGLSAPAFGGRANADFGHGHREFGAADFYAPFPSFETTTTRSASAGWRSSAERPITVEPRVSWRSHDDDFILIREDPSVYRNQHTSAQLAGEITLRGDGSIVPAMGAWSGLAWAIGGEVRRHSLESNSLGERDEDRHSVFGEIALDRGRFGGTAGIRHDSHEAFDGATSPSLSGFWQITDRTSLRASWGRSFRGPTWTERYYVDPAHEARAELDPERSSSIEAGLAVRPAPGIELAATGFRRVSRDLIDWAREPVEDPLADPPVWETRNVNRATFRGLELEGSWTTPRGLVLSVGASLLSLEADAEAGLESKYALRPLTEKITVHLGRELAGGVRGALMALHGKRPGESGFRTVDLRLEREVLDGRLHFELRNLGDSEHLDVTGNPVAGRSIVVGYGLTLR